MAKTQGTRWENKIVGYGLTRTDQLLGNEANWRIHPKNQQDSLSGVLHDVGLVQNVIINRRTSDKWPDGQRGVETMVDGHLRAMLALSDGQEELPATYVDLTPEEEALVLATFDPLSAMAAADKEKLDALLHDVSTNDAAVQAMLSELAEKSGLMPSNVEFKEYDESVEAEVEYLTCPSCGHKWPK